MRRHSATDLRELCTRVLVAAGAPLEEAVVTADHLVGASLRGHDSHGVHRMIEYSQGIRQGIIVAPARFTIIAETAVILRADAGLGLGPVQCARLVDALIAKAAAHGIGCGAMLRSGHVGRLGGWVERATQAGMAALMLVNDNGTEQLVAPPGGTQAITSTNPLAFGAPSDRGCFIFDMSTSAVAAGKVRLRKQQNAAAETGWLQDAAGNPTTDPAVLWSNPRGSLLPFGGEMSFKGFGLSMMVDMLAAGLSGGFTPPAPAGTDESNNVVMVVWDPKHFAGFSHWSEQADRLLDAVRANRPKAGSAFVSAPGDRSARQFAERTAQGVPIDDETWSAIVDNASKLGIPNLRG